MAPVRARSFSEPFPANSVSFTHGCHAAVMRLSHQIGSGHERRSTKAIFRRKIRNAAKYFAFPPADSTNLHNWLKSIRE
jgi:hypothetical protein